jgi:hypothetical protein
MFGMVLPDMSGIANLAPTLGWYEMTASATGGFVINAEDCPLGKVRLITHVFQRWFNGGCNRINLEIRDTAGVRQMVVTSQVNPVQFQGYYNPNPFMIFQGQHLTGWYSITTSGATCSLGYLFVEFDWTGKLI